MSRPNELEELKLQAGQITDESLEATRRMANMMVETEETGMRTIEALKVQREQLNHIEDGMDHINTEMSQAEKSLNRLKRCCNVCSTPWKKVPTEVDSNNENKTETAENKGVIVDQPRRYNKDGPVENPTIGYIKRITNDAREDEMDANLCQVNDILGNIREMALDMNTELEVQNEQIKRITDKGDANNIRLQQANISANDLLRR